MKLFISSLSAETDIISGLQDKGVKLYGSVDVSPTIFFWFRPYLASDFPEIVCDKKYFFLYSTNHAGETEDYYGGVWWGKGDNLDLSDFVEVAQVLPSEYQIETPFLIRIPEAECGDSEVLHLFFHPNQSWPGESYQETRLYTSVGGFTLDNVTWTDNGTVLGLEAGETHTGYCKVYKNGVSDYTAIHLTKGGQTPQPFYTSFSADGRNWTRGDAINTQLGLADLDWEYKSPNGQFFSLYGKNWFIGAFQDITLDTIPYGRTLSMQCVLTSVDDIDRFKSDGLLEIIDDSLWINWDVYIENGWAYCYGMNTVSQLTYGRYDLRNLKKFV